MKKIILTFSLVLIGCATSADLHYQTSSAKQSAKNVFVLVRGVKDERPASEKGVIGKIRNGYGMILGDISESPTLFKDLKNALSAELINAGYALSENADDLVIQSSLVYLSSDVNPYPNTGIKLKFVVIDHGQEVLNHLYEADAKVLISLGYGVDPALLKATKKILLAFIQDLNQYIQT